MKYILLGLLFYGPLYSYSCSHRYSHFTAIVTSVEHLSEYSCKVKVENFYNIQADKECPLLKSEVDLRGITLIGAQCKILKKGSAIKVNAEANLHAISMI